MKAKSERELMLAGARDYIEFNFGVRCKSKDIEDFPELKNETEDNRCPSCVAWEYYDFWVKETRKNAKHG